MHPPAWEILCRWIKLEGGEGTGPQDLLARQKKGVRCDPSELVVFSDIAAMKILPQTSAMGGDVRMDRQTHGVGKTWGGSARERKEQKRDQSPTCSIARDVLGLLLCGWCCHKQD